MHTCGCADGDLPLGGRFASLRNEAFVPPPPAASDTAGGERTSATSADEHIPEPPTSRWSGPPAAQYPTNAQGWNPARHSRNNLPIRGLLPAWVPVEDVEEAEQGTVISRERTPKRRLAGMCSRTQKETSLIVM